MSNSAFITRVGLRNYKSIAACDVELGALAFLVGPNGAGKSNFLDALRFVADAVNTSLDHALRDRGGIKEVRRRSGGHPTHFQIQLEFRLRDGISGRYSFHVGARPQGGYEVSSEECHMRSADALNAERFYRVEAGNVVEASFGSPPSASSDRLYLVNVSGFPEFRPLSDALGHMGFYSLSPDRIRDLQAPDSGEILSRDGSNIASVLALLESEAPSAKRRIEEYLARVVPGITGVAAKHLGPRETIEFRQETPGGENPWRFLAMNMSDGTLRALGILVALFQAENGQRGRVSLVGIEEPELALHPAAAGIVRECLKEAGTRVQVLVTSHSPDLLDDASILDDCILPVVCEEGVTLIAPLDEAGRGALRDRLYTAGEMLRLNRLVPDRTVTESAGATQGDLFGEEG